MILEASLGSDWFGAPNTTAQVTFLSLGGAVCLFGPQNLQALSVYRQAAADAVVSIACRKEQVCRVTHGLQQLCNNPLKQ